jgi:hypothetical protein
MKLPLDLGLNRVFHSRKRNLTTYGFIGFSSLVTWIFLCAQSPLVHETTHRLLPQVAQQDVISAPEHLPSNCTDHPSFKDPNDTALAPAPAIAGESTNPAAQSPYTYSVSKQKLDRRHCLPRYPQDVLGEWPLPAQCRSRYCLYHDSSCLLDAKLSWIQISSHLT